MTIKETETKLIIESIAHFNAFTAFCKLADNALTEKYVEIFDEIAYKHNCIYQNLDKALDALDKIKALYNEIDELKLDIEYYSHLLVD